MLTKPAQKPRSVAAAPAAVVVTTREEADNATLRWLEASRMCARLQREFEDEFGFLCDRYNAEYERHERIAEANEAAVVAFAQSVLDIANNGRARKTKLLMLEHGTVRFSRAADCVVFKVPLERLITNLRRSRLGRFIKRTESVLATELRKINPALRAKLGFTVEPSPVVGKLLPKGQSHAMTPDFT